MEWLQNIFKNERRLEEIEIQELKLLQEKSRELEKLLEDIRGIMELAMRAKIDHTVRLPANQHERLMKKLELIRQNLEEEISLERDIEKREKKRRE